MLDRRQHKAVFFSRYTCINNNMETTELSNDHFGFADLLGVINEELF